MNVSDGLYTRVYMVACCCGVQSIEPPVRVNVFIGMPSACISISPVAVSGLLVSSVICINTGLFICIFVIISLFSFFKSMFVFVFTEKVAVFC